MPIAWMKERPIESEVEIPFSAVWKEVVSGSSPAGGMAAMSVGTPGGGGGGGGSGTSISWKPVFVRASLGLIDSDTDTLDDGFELWYFQSLSEMASGNPDNDGLSNEDEFVYSTNPNVADTDDDGSLDGSEVSRGTNPLTQDHPDVNLVIYTGPSK
jgi:hypothetical protein